MAEVSLVIRDDGTLVSLDTEDSACFKSLGTVTSRRASHVEPDNRFFRLAFHILRRFYGDKGRMSEFTRSWPCLWRANLAPVGGPILPGRWSNRLEAIDAEVVWLNKHLV